MKPRVLYVEPDELSQGSAVTFLEREFEVQMVATGNEALTLLQANTYDVLVTENLPSLNAEKLVKQAKARYPSLPIIMLSAYEPHEDLPVRFINKREDPLTFLKTLKELAGIR
ncbi:MAG TPA: response regulator [Patescibacteria group bacterium]|nr:response regulator [Patescibacteria group bacterium]